MTDTIPTAPARAASEDISEQSYSHTSNGGISHGAAVAITERLSEMPDLPLPSSMYQGGRTAPPTETVLCYLQQLLQKDPAAFLARYGSQLQSQELNHFAGLRADYEVAHWLDHWREAAEVAAAHEQDPRRLPARVKNRRLAAMRRLAAEGEYFSDEAMRQRAPLLYHQHIGQYMPDEGQQQGQGAPQGGGAAEQQQQQQGEGSGGDKPREDEAAKAGCGPWGGACLAAALREALAHSEGRGRQEEGQAGPGVSGAGGEVEMQDAAGGSGSVGPAAGPSGWAAANADVGGGFSGGSGPGRAPQGGGGGDGSRGGDGGGGGGGGNAAQLFSEFLLRQDDEAQLVMRRMREQEEEDAQLSEHDSDDDDDQDNSEDDDSEDLPDADNRAGASSRAAAGAPAAAHGRPTSIRSGQLQPRPHHAPTAAQQGLGAQHAQLHHHQHHAGGRSHAGGRKGRHSRHAPNGSELAQLRRDFLSEMESRFLLGQDGGHGVDYAHIDADASLDGDWLAQEERDAEDKYFDED